MKKIDLKKQLENLKIIEDEMSEIIKSQDKTNAIEPDEERKKVWLEHGINFGYPECCIEAFLNESARTRAIRKFAGTGFIPCSSCNKRSRKEIVIKINENRKDSTQFLNDKALKRVVKFVEGVKKARANRL